jgi:hypothetical protein
MQKTPPLKTNIYPNQKSATFWQRFKVAWRVLFYKEFFPAPYQWYEHLYPIVSSQYSHFASQAVDKSEREFASGIGTQDIRKKEALQWMRHYAEAAGKSTDIPAWQSNFLIEWWVLRRKGLL